MKWYFGYISLSNALILSIFKSRSKPKQSTHEQIFMAVNGPYKSFSEALGAARDYRRSVNATVFITSGGYSFMD